MNCLLEMMLIIHYKIVVNFTNLSFLVNLQRNLSLVLINVFKQSSLGVDRIYPVFLKFLYIHNKLLY